MSQLFAGNANRNLLVLASRNGVCKQVYRYPIDRETIDRLNREGYYLELRDVESLAILNNGTTSHSNSQVHHAHQFSGVTIPPNSTGTNNGISGGLNATGRSLMETVIMLGTVRIQEMTNLYARINSFESRLADLEAQRTLQQNQLEMLQAANVQTRAVVNYLEKSVTRLWRQRTPTEPAATERQSIASIQRCSQCHKVFSGLSKLMIHSVIHESGPTYTCKYRNCKRASEPFSATWKLQNHIRNVHCKTFQCAHTADNGRECGHVATCFATIKTHIQNNHSTETGFMYRKIDV